MKRIFGHTSGSSGRSSGQTSGGSGRSSSSSSTKGDEAKAPPTDAMSTTARLILDTLEKMSTPLKDSDKMPTLSVDRKRVADELNQSLGLNGSARKRPRLGTGPMQSSSPLGGPPFRKLYSPLSVHRSRPPRVKHITPMPSLYNSRPSTPSGLDSSSTFPPPPNIPLTAFSTPLSSPGGDGGGKLRNKVTGRGAEIQDDEELPPPLPSFLTNNVPQLKVSTPMTSFSFSTSSSSTPTAASYKDASAAIATENDKAEKEKSTTTKLNSSESKSMTHSFGLTQPLTTISASNQDLQSKQAEASLPSFGSQIIAGGNKTAENNKKFSFSSPVQTFKQDSGAANGSPTAFSKESMLSKSIKTADKSSAVSAFTNGVDTLIQKDIKVTKNTLSNHYHEEDTSASRKAEGGVHITNGGYKPRIKEFTFDAPSCVIDSAESKSIMEKACCMNFIFTPPKPVGKGK